MTKGVACYKINIHKINWKGDIPIKRKVSLIIFTVIFVLATVVPCYAEEIQFTTEKSMYVQRVQEMLANVFANPDGYGIEKDVPLQVELNRSTVLRTLDMNMYTQPVNTGLCWACCLASMGEYETGLVYEPENLALWYGVPVNEGASIAESSTIYYAQYGVANTYSNSAMSRANIIEKINGGIPVLAGFLTVDSSGHNCVIRGYAYDSSVVNAPVYVSLMNPWYTTFTQATYTSTNLSFVGDGKTWIFVSYLHSI